MKFIILFRRRDTQGAPLGAAAVNADSFEEAMDPYGRFKNCTLLYALKEAEASELIRSMQAELSGPVGSWYPIKRSVTVEQLKEIITDPKATDENVLEAFLNTELWNEDDVRGAVELLKEERPSVFAGIEAYALESTRCPMDQMEKYGVTVEKQAKCPICGSDLNTETNPPTCPKCGTEGIEKKSEGESEQSE